eukprot:2826720-Pleurochrysis_carterae.AAC.1
MTYPAGGQEPTRYLNTLRRGLGASAGAGAEARLRGAGSSTGAGAGARLRGGSGSGALRPQARSTMGAAGTPELEERSASAS